MCDNLPVSYCKLRANETRPMRVDMILTASLTQRRLVTRDIHGLRNDSQSKRTRFQRQVARVAG